MNRYITFADLPAGTYPRVTASFPGSTSSTFVSIVVTDGGTTTRDFVLGVAATSGCFLDTTQADFQTGVATNCDLAGSPGDVLLASIPSLDQQNLTVTTSGFGFNSTSWAGQTFRPALTGAVTKVELDLFCSGCTGTTPNITVAIRATTGSPAVPTGADLATATIPGFSSASGGYMSATFATPATLTAGTTYAIVVRATANPSAGTYAYVCSCTSPNSNPYADGQRVTSANSGGAWSVDVTSGGRDLGFKVSVDTGFTTTGSLVSSAKDGNPAMGSSPTWGTLSWAATTPATTDVSLQAAGSDDPAGPFNFVGPDETAATFFTSGGSLSQFDGFRYLKYKAFLNTSNGAVSPTLQSVSVCFSDLVVTTLTVAPAGGSYGGTANLTATLSGGAGIAGKTVGFTLNGTSAGSGTTDGSGVATVLAASLVGINAGIHPGGVAAAFAGDTGFAPGNGANTLTVAPASQTITFDPLADRFLHEPDFGVSATASSLLPVAFAAAGQCAVTPDGTVVHLTGAGSCTITASQAGDGNYQPATDVLQAFTITDDLIFRDGFED
jgi:hypothetical protein